MAAINATFAPASYRSGKKNQRMGVPLRRIAPLGPYMGYGFSSQWHGLLYRGPLSGSRAPQGKSSHEPAIGTRRNSNGMRTSWRHWSAGSDEVLNVVL